MGTEPHLKSTSQADTLQMGVVRQFECEAGSITPLSHSLEDPGHSSWNNFQEKQHLDQ